MAQRIAVYSVPDLKNTTDDSLAPYLRSRKQFTQDHLLSDVRLALGYMAVAVAAITFYFDYTSTWDKTKDLTLWAVVAYSILNGGLTLWIWAVEKGKIFVGRKHGLLVSFASSSNKFEPTYRLRVLYKDSSSGSVSDEKSVDVVSSYSKWFTSDGQFIAEKFYSWLDSEIFFLQPAKQTPVN